MSASSNFSVFAQAKVVRAEDFIVDDGSMVREVKLSLATLNTRNILQDREAPSRFGLASRHDNRLHRTKRRLGNCSYHNARLAHALANAQEYSKAAVRLENVIDWFVYWFMFPACILIASVAMLTGISGTAMLTPFLILVFPVLSVPTLTPGQAVGMALFTEFFGFASGAEGCVRGDDAWALSLSLPDSNWKRKEQKTRSAP